ncbi:MAG: hypothetical protein AAFX55_02000 [Bacteroidota bacterium]
MKKLALLVSLLSIAMVLGQNGQNIDMMEMPVSPEAYQFEKYTSLPVDLNSGMAQVSIPLYTISYGGMTIPISISYDTSGIKPEEISGNVGLKWTLNVGGSINRILKGGQDEGSPYINGSTQAPIQANGYYKDYGFSNFESFDFSNHSIIYSASIMNDFLKNLAEGSKDLQPDLYALNSLGVSARFFFDENRNLILFTESDLKIEPSLLSANGGHYFEWKATDTNGIEMYFGENGIVEKSKSSTYGSISGTGNHFTNSWGLNRLRNLSTNKEITFEYAMEEFAYCTITNPTKISSYRNSLIQPLYPFTHSGAYDEAVNGNLQISRPSSVETSITKPVISKIVAGNIEVVFNSSQRNDVYSRFSGEAKKIDEMLVLYNGNCIKKVVFNYSYHTTPIDPVAPSFPTNAPSEFHKSFSKVRLILDSIEEIDCGGNLAPKTYSFHYNTIPLPSQITFAKDKWGYYNGANTNLSLFPQYYDIDNFVNQAVTRKAVETYSKAMNLEKIVYPTGGSVEFDYEIHRSDTPVYGNSEGGYDFQIIGSVGGFAAGYNGTNGGDLYHETDFNSSDNKQISTTLNLGGSYPGDEMMDDIYCRADESEIAVQIWSLLDNQLLYQKTFNDMVTNTEVFPTITYNDVLQTALPIKVRTYFTYQPNTGRPCMSARATVEAMAPTPPTADDYLVGGCRIKQIQYKDSDGSLSHQKTYVYESPNLVDNPQYTYESEFNFDISFGGLVNVQEWTQAMGQNFVSTHLTSASSQFFYVTPAESRNRLDFQGSHMTYSKVTETDGNGKSEYFFHNHMSYAEASGYASDDIPPKPALQSSRAGKLQKQLVYNNNDGLLKEEFYDYSLENINTPIRGLGITSVVYNSYYSTPYREYSLYPQISRLVSKRTKDYFQGNEVATTINYFYEGSNHNQPTRIETLTSKGELTEEHNLYPSDMPPNEPFMSVLTSENRIATPVAIRTYRDNVPLQAQKTIYKLENGLILPDEIKMLKHTDDLANLETRLTFHRYDNDGNPLEMSKPGGVRVIYVWGYDDTQPIAKIENASYTNLSAAQQSAIDAVKAASNNDIDTSTEDALRTAFATLRAEFPEAMVISYTYDPLVGVTSITDPKGDTVYYEYDDLNRLKLVKDQDGNIVSHNEYHFANQN